MPRGSGGVYTLPAGNPVVSGTVIASSWANPTMDDLGAALTDSLSRTGNGGMQAAFKNIDGVETSPSDTFNNDPLTGRYLAAVGDMRDTVSGVDQVRYTPQGLSVTDGAGGWIPVLGSGSGAILIQTDFTNVAGQSVFTTAEANSSADCYINGSLLANADYTFTLGNTITLAEPVKSALDVVSILGYGAFDLADPAGARAAIDVYSTEESDAGNKNYLINGDMHVVQRGNVVFSSSSLAYGGCDRWLTGVSGTTVSTVILQTALALNRSKYSQQVGNVTTTGASAVSLSQRIEAVSTFGLSNRTVTISGYVLQQTGAPQDFQIVLRKAIGVDDFSSNTTITAQPVFSIPDNLATYVEYTYTLGASDGTNGIEVNYSFPSLPAMTNAQFYFSELQLNTGAIAKPFIYTPIGETLALCQRYYQSYGFRLAASRINDDQTSRYFSAPRSVTMRAAPTETGTTSSGTVTFGASAGVLLFEVTGVAATDGIFMDNYTADAELK